MAARIVGPLRAEHCEPVSDKFTAPLLLVPGLWGRAADWRACAGYLAHRGWRCTALEMRVRADGSSSASVAERSADLRAALAACAAPPVVIGHDLGALLAVQCAGAARAAVALAPLVGPPLAPPPEALQRAGSWLARRRGAPLRAPGGRWRRAYPNRDADEPAALVAEVLQRTPAIATAVHAPCAVFSAADDPVTSLAAAAALAKAIGAEQHGLAGGGHALWTEPGWEARAAALHRWLIQHLGGDLLALYDDAMDPS